MAIFRYWHCHKIRLKFPAKRWRWFYPQHIQSSGTPNKSSQKNMLFLLSMAHPTEEPNPKKFDLLGKIFFHLLPKIHLEQQNPNKTFWKTRSSFIGVSFIVSCCVAQLLILPVRCSSSYKALREQDFNHTAEEGKARYLFFYSGQEHNSELQSPRSHSIFSKSWRGKRLLSCNSWHWFPLLCNLPLPSSLSTTPSLWFKLVFRVLFNSLFKSKSQFSPN